MTTKLNLYTADCQTQQAIPCADEGIKAGFPSPAQGYMAESIDLNKELVRHPATTFYARVVGDSMCDAGIGDGDLLVVDKGLEPHDGDVVVAFLDGEFTLKRIRMDAGSQVLWLVPENEAYTPIRVDASNEFVIWGVVTYSIRRQSRRTK